VVAQELAAIRSGIGEEAFSASRFSEAGRLFEAVALDDDYAEFLTLPGSQYIA
jgi:malate synthase